MICHYHPHHPSPLLPQQGLLMLRFLLCRTLVLEATTHIYSVAVSICSSVSWVAPLPPPVFLLLSLPLPACLFSFPFINCFVLSTPAAPVFFLLRLSLFHSRCVCVSWVCHQLFPPQPHSLYPSSPPSAPLLLFLFLYCCSASSSPRCLLPHKFYFD